ncbi:choline ABC transporter substrate-binding protein [Legionella brunensis]|uniref:Glycine betaine/carnitine transport binding protein GbuC n=1 Tax=Legionella brunensis TaxID=29422 RepID=A0A0W0SPL1_9GAMM|nr:choline ABC transporter substrate-binding protein [Legionella brunensis]KTC85165.1 Glycine betaine/carnitine transport binding protein GbuC precursor [Legionella brunensis]
MTRSFTKFLKIFLVGVSLILWVTAIIAKDADFCKKVRLSDVGWTDITANTAMVSAILEMIGYEANITQMSVPVTFASLKKGDIDVFLGNWMPSMANDIKPYHDEGSIETIGMNLEGAKYTLAVDKALYDKGLHDVTDIAKFKDQLGGKIYGIESGNEGNRHILDMIKNPQLNLQGWELVESSEAGMLAQVAKNIKANKNIIFLGWAPHPMNLNYKIAYLTGFGRNYGNASVFTVVRKGYVKNCPNVGRFFANLKFSMEMENQLMSEILEKGVDPTIAAITWLKSNPKVLKEWLDGVTTFDASESAFDAIKNSPGF